MTFKVNPKIKKLIIFDMDGLFFDSETIYARAWQEGIEQVGVVVPENFIKSLRGCGARDNDNALLSYCGSKEKVQEIRKIRNDYFVQELNKGNVNLCFYALEVAKLFKSKGIKIALASSSSTKIVFQLLHSKNLDTFFDFVVTGDDVKNVKPSPEIYKKVLNQTGFSKKETLAFEDSVTGATSAVRAGVEVKIISKEVPQDFIKIDKKCIKVYKDLELAYEDLFTHNLI